MPLTFRFRIGDCLVDRKVCARLAEDQKFDFLAVRLYGNDGIVHTRFYINSRKHELSGWKARSAGAVCLDNDNFQPGAGGRVQPALNGQITILWPI